MIYLSPTQINNLSQHYVVVTANNLFYLSYLDTLLTLTAPSPQSSEWLRVDSNPPTPPQCALGKLECNYLL
jgi:hypothetical protein